MRAPPLTKKLAMSPAPCPGSYEAGADLRTPETNERHTDGTDGCFDSCLYSAGSLVMCNAHGLHAITTTEKEACNVSPALEV